MSQPVSRGVGARRETDRASDETGARLKRRAAAPAVGRGGAGCVEDDGSGR